MFEERKFRFPLFAVLTALIVFLFHYTGAVTLKIGNASPMLFLPLVVAVGMYYGEVTGLIYGLFTGFLIDSTASGTYCFNTVFFCFAGFAVGVAVILLFNSNFPAAVTLNVIVCFLYFAIKWVIFYFIPDVQGKIYFLFRYLLPSAFYSSLFIIPIFFAEKYFAERYKKKNNINNI